MQQHGERCCLHCNIDEDEDEDDEEEEDCVLDIVMTVNLLKRRQVLQLKVDE